MHVGVVQMDHFKAIKRAAVYGACTCFNGVLVEIPYRNPETSLPAEKIVVMLPQQLPSSVIFCTFCQRTE